mgnify:CR=1 FL=1
MLFRSAWKHDLYGSAPQQDGGAPATSRPRVHEGSNRRTARLIITNLHYEVSERELEVRLSLCGSDEDEGADAHTTPTASLPPDRATGHAPQDQSTGPSTLSSLTSSR